MAQILVQKHGYAVRQACNLLDLSPSSYYYQSQATKDQTLEADLKLLAGQHPTYGTRRLTHQLRRKPFSYQVNRKRIQRLARRFDLLRPEKRQKTRTTDSQHPYPRYENLVKTLEGHMSPVVALAISPDGGTLYALLEGAAAGDHPQDLRIYVYRVAERTFAGAFLRLRLELPSQTVNLATLTNAAGARVYPDAAPPPAGPVAIGELKAVNDHQLLVIERDNLGDDLMAPRFKKLFLLDLSHAAAHGGYVGKTLLVDLLAIPDPSGIGGDGDFFRLPFYTIESVHVVDRQTLLVASDNNYPFSNGRSRSRSADRRGPLAADDTEMVLVRLGTPLDADPRLFPAGAR